MWGTNSLGHQMLYALPPMKSGSTIFARPSRRLLSGFGMAMLFAGLGASAPAHAETAMAPVLVPASIQLSAFDAAFTPLDTAPRPAAEQAVSVQDEGQLLGSGLASWYGKEFKGRRTASGEAFDPSGLTAAHPSLPFGSMVRVTNIKTGQNVVVRINDRGPYTHKRMIDVSQAAARELGLIGPGSGQVSIALLGE